MNSRDKGKRGEREWAKEVQTNTGRASRRGQQFKGSPDSPDVITEGLPYHWEVKRVEAGNPYKWMDQATADVGEDQVPVVATRRNGRGWLVILHSNDFFDLVNTVYKTDNES